MCKHLGFSGTQIPGSHHRRNGRIRNDGKPRIALYPGSHCRTVIASFNFAQYSLRN